MLLKSVCHDQFKVFKKKKKHRQVQTRATLIVPVLVIIFKVLLKWLNNCPAPPPPSFHARVFDSVAGFVANKKINFC